MNAPMHPPSFHQGPQDMGPPASNTLATTSLVTGIIATVSLVICCPPASMIGLYILPLGPSTVLGVVAGITGFMGLNTAKETGVGRGNAMAGLIMGIVNAVAGVAFIVLMIIFGAALLAMMAAQGA